MSHIFCWVYNFITAMTILCCKFISESCFYHVRESELNPESCWAESLSLPLNLSLSLLIYLNSEIKIRQAKRRGPWKKLKNCALLTNPPPPPVCPFCQRKKNPKIFIFASVISVSFAQIRPKSDISISAGHITLKAFAMALGYGTKCKTCFEVLEWFYMLTEKNTFPK